MEEHHCRYYRLPYALWPCLMTIRGIINRKRSFLDIAMHTNTPKVNASFFQGFMNTCNFNCKSMHHSTLWWFFSTPFACKNSFDSLRLYYVKLGFTEARQRFTAVMTRDPRNGRCSEHIWWRWMFLSSLDAPETGEKGITAISNAGTPHTLCSSPVLSLRGPQFLSCRWHGTSNILPCCFYHFHQCI